MSEAPFSIPSVDTDVIDVDIDEDGTVKPGETVRYPHSTIIVKSGDVLVSDKSWDATKFVGHSAIVGSDFLVREVLTGSTPGKTRSLSTHLTNQSGGTVKIYRHSNTTARAEAGQWAVNNVNKVTSYRFSTNLKDVSYNYCSKFVWQAFNKNGYTAGYLSNVSLVGLDTHGYVYPDSFSYNMKFVGSYR
nr:MULTISPECIES: YiiX/YebB-like N1pC/P60 family cysteine hydrolase [unclassified Exiguobacterium]